MPTTLYHLRFEPATLIPSETTDPTETVVAATTPSTSFLEGISSSFTPTSFLNPSSNLDPPSVTPANSYPRSSENPSENTDTVMTRAEVRQIVDEKLNSLKIYVLESDITQAQQAVKSIVELASF